MKLTEKHIEQYIETHRLAWEETTKKSERSRLVSVLSALQDQNPETLWKHLELKGIKPYSRVTTWTRVVSFVDWAISQKIITAETNPYKDWRKKNARLFRHVYEKKSPSISLEEAKARIAKIQNPSIKHKALELLYSGLRYSESLTLDYSNSSVIGKGRKGREVFISPELSNGPKYQGSYFQFWKELSKVGLKPHMLRKIRATDLARKGMDIRSLCEVMGWSRIETAMSYLAPMEKEKLKEFFVE